MLKIILKLSILLGPAYTAAYLSDGTTASVIPTLAASLLMLKHWEDRDVRRVDECEYAEE